MRHDAQQHEEDGHGHYNDIVTNTATQKKHIILCDMCICICILKDRCKPNMQTWVKGRKLNT